MKARSLLVGGAVLASLLAAPAVALAQPGTSACDEAKASVVDLRAALDKVKAAELVDETKALNDAKAALAAALPPVRDLNPLVYPGGKVPSLDALTPAFLQSLLAKADKDGSASQLGGGGREAINTALAKYKSVDAAEDALKKDSSVLSGARASLQIAELTARRACAPVPPTTTPALTTTPRPTTTTPAPPVTSPSVSDDDDSAALPEVAPETGGFEN